MAPSAFITGLAGLTLTPEDVHFLHEVDPWGVILFKRNISSPAQVSDLIEAVRQALGRRAPVLVDQEGGRVQRLGPPHWPSYPPGARYGEIYRHSAADGLAAAELGGRLIAADLAALGIDVDCLPIADVPVATGDPVIGDRAYGTTPAQVSALGAAIARGLLRGGVLPVLKHLPGHGRATADSHHGLPVVTTARAELETTDFAAFRPLAGLPLGMTAHVVFSAIDAVAPATTSATMVREVIRGDIGFQGLLMSDDISMEALTGSLTERSRAALAAGCDVVLHCNGNLDEMREVAAAVPRLAGTAATRAAAALEARRAPDDVDVAAGHAVFARMMAGEQAAGKRIAGS